MWREEFVFPSDAADKELTVSVHDEDVVSSDLIGKLTLNLRELLAPLAAAAPGDPSSRIDRFFDLQEGAMGRDKQTRPRIRLIFEFVPLTEVPFPSPHTPLHARRPPCPAFMIAAAAAFLRLEDSPPSTHRHPFQRPLVPSTLSPSTE
jgi:hypothetical protein